MANGNKSLTHSLSVNSTPPKQDDTPPPTPAEIILSQLRQGPDGRYINAFEVLSSVETLKLAYETIKSKPGNLVRGTTRETLDGITED